jgi:hypothetical protein
MPKSKKVTKPAKQPQPEAKAEVAVARRPRLFDQAIARVREAVEAALDLADAAAHELRKRLQA